MRVTSITLENYVGLLEGTGRSEILVDFRPAHEARLNRVFLLGRNGSGKTTILNSLTPFPSNGDGRTSQIADGRPGRKVITFARGGGLPEVECDIRTSSKGKTSCFMSIGGEPVHETAKGNIGEYLRAVQAHLGVTPEYLRIGRVTGRVGNFLDLGPGQRKEFIGQFMPEIEDWSVMHKAAAKRLQLLKAQLSGLQVELDRIEAREELEAGGRRSEADAARLREEVRRHDTRLGAARGALAELSPARAAVLARAGNVEDPGEFNPLPAWVALRTSQAEAATARVAALARERPLLERFGTIEAAEVKIGQVREGLGYARGTAEASATARAEGRASLDRAIQAQEAASRLLRQAADSGAQMEGLAAQAPPLEEAIRALVEEVAPLPPAPNGVSYDEVKSACDVLAGLEAELAACRAAFPAGDALDAACRAGLDDGAMLTQEAALANRARELREKAEVARTRITRIEAQAQFHGRFSGMHCSDPKCPFESHIGQYATAAEELVGKREESQRLDERAAEADAARADLGAARAASKQALALHARLRRHRAALEAAGAWDAVGPSEAFLTLLASTGTASAEALSARTLLRSISLRRELTERRRTLDALREREEGLRQLAAARAGLAAAADRSAAEVAAARTGLADLDEAADRAQGTVAAQEAALTLLEQLAELLRTAAAAAADAERLLDLSTGLEAMRERWELARAEEEEAGLARAAASSSLEEAERALGDARLRLARRDEYEARLAEVAGRVRMSQLVTEACHPARGAPVEFLRDFLDATRDGVNELLDIAMGGEFRLGFVVSDTEFRVPVSRGSGRVIPDVTEASEGQLALAKTVLSLALVRQTVMAAGGFNVICLDECDGPLDREKNRDRFVDIIDRLIRELGVEQLIAISHNDSFHAVPAGLILLPGHAMPVDDPSFMGNKVILADFS